MNSNENMINYSDWYHNSKDLSVHAKFNVLVTFCLFHFNLFADAFYVFITTQVIMNNNLKTFNIIHFA